MKKQNASLQAKKHFVQLGPNENLIDIRYDEVFKAVFTSESHESRTALSKLVSAMLGQEVSMLRIVENEPAITDVKNRKISFDINCRAENGERINVELTIQEKWALFFEYLTNVKYRDKINEIINKEEGIIMATRALTRITRSDREWAYQESKLKYKLDRDTLIYETKRIAKAQGKRDKALEIARNMIAKGRPLEQIAEDTGLSLKKISKLNIN